MKSFYTPGIQIEDDELGSHWSYLGDNGEVEIYFIEISNKYLIRVMTDLAEDLTREKNFASGNAQKGRKELSEKLKEKRIFQYGNYLMTDRARLEEFYDAIECESPSQILNKDEKKRLLEEFENQSSSYEPPTIINVRRFTDQNSLVLKLVGDNDSDNDLYIPKESEDEADEHTEEDKDDEEYVEKGSQKKSVLGKRSHTKQSGPSYLKTRKVNKKAQGPSSHADRSTTLHRPVAPALSHISMPASFNNPYGTVHGETNVIPQTRQIQPQPQTSNLPTTPNLLMQATLTSLPQSPSYCSDPDCPINRQTIATSQPRQVQPQTYNLPTGLPLPWRITCIRSPYPSPSSCTDPLCDIYGGANAISQTRQIQSQTSNLASVAIPASTSNKKTGISPKLIFKANFFPYPSEKSSNDKIAPKYIGLGDLNRFLYKNRNPNRIHFPKQIVVKETSTPSGIRQECNINLAKLFEDSTSAFKLAEQESQAFELVNNTASKSSSSFFLK